MGILLALIAGMFIPFTNLTIQKSIDVGGNAKAYFVFQMLTSLLLSILLGPVRTGNFSIHLPVAVLGTLAGLILSIMIFSLKYRKSNGRLGCFWA